MKKFIKILSVILCLAFMTSFFAGCATAENRTVISVNGQKVPVYKYQYIMTMLILQVYNQYGANIEDLTTQNIKIGTQPIKEYLSAAAADQVIYQAMADKLFDDLGYTFDETLTTELNSYLTQVETNYGGAETFESTLTSMGLTRNMYTESIKSSIKMEKIMNTYYGETGTEPVTTADAKKVYASDYVRVKHILFKTVDSSGNALTAGDIATAKASYEKVLAAVKKSGANFDALMKKNSEDTQLTDYPDGYVFGPDSSSYPSDFVTASIALKMNEIGSVKSTIGYHIIKRLPLDNDKYFTQVETEILANLRQTKLDAKLDTLIKAATVKKEEKLIAKLDNALFSITYGASTTTD